MIQYLVARDISKAEFCSIWFRLQNHFLLQLPAHRACLCTCIHLSVFQNGNVCICSASNKNISLLTPAKGAYLYQHELENKRTGCMKKQRPSCDRGELKSFLSGKQRMNFFSVLDPVSGRQSHCSSRSHTQLTGPVCVYARLCCTVCPG